MPVAICRRPEFKWWCIREDVTCGILGVTSYVLYIYNVHHQRVKEMFNRFITEIENDKVTVTTGGHLPSGCHNDNC
jgi:hypothetical protein